MSPKKAAAKPMHDMGGGMMMKGAKHPMPAQAKAMGMPNEMPMMTGKAAALKKMPMSAKEMPKSMKGGKKK